MKHKKIILCSWNLCKHSFNGICNHPNGIDDMLKGQVLKIYKNNMMHCKMYSSK